MTFHAWDGFCELLGELLYSCCSCCRTRADGFEPALMRSIAGSF